MNYKNSINLFKKESCFFLSLKGEKFLKNSSKLHPLGLGELILMNFKQVAKVRLLIFNFIDNERY